MPQRPAKRLLVIGWDAADWIVLDSLFAKNAMPTLAGLIARGVRSDLRTLEPILSPLLWTSAATGRTPDVHGILNFVEPRPDGTGLCVAGSTSRKVKALWNMATQQGLRVQCTSWYASHPAEPVRGIVVSNMLMEGDPGVVGGDWPLAPDTVHPPGFAGPVALARVGRAAFHRDHLAEVMPELPARSRGDARVASLCKLMATAASVDAVARAAMAREPWDLAMVFFESIDTVGHQFMQYRPPRLRTVREDEVRTFGGVMDAVYQWHDRALARLLAAAGPDTTVLLLSDHGFHSGELRPDLGELPPERRMEKEASWHRPIGVLVASGPGVVPGAATATASILDLTPTALALLGLQQAADFDGRVLSEILSPHPAPPAIASWETLPGDAGLHPADRRQDPFEANDAIRQLVDLGYMAALPADATDQIELVRRESLFNLGVHLTSRGKIVAALPHFEALVERKPDDVRYRICLASCLGATGAHARVVELLAAMRGSAEADLVLARSLHELGRTDEAVAAAQRVAGAIAGSPLLRTGLAECLLHLGRYDEALRLVREARRADPKAMASILLESQALLCTGAWENAAEAALDALDLERAHPEAHWLLGCALAWYGDLAQALQSLQLGLQFAPCHLPSLRTAAVVARALGDADGAAEFARRGDAVAATDPPLALRPLPFAADALAARLGSRRT
ncbi:MAG: alkaline phosphatase family protein [Planctomycetes bacterium]|nr:alkaline phosphatase family protein [Planctomycetota bacterium]